MHLKKLMNMIRTSLNYKRSKRYAGSYYYHQEVIELDTSVDTAVKNSNSSVDAQTVKGQYLDSEDPVDIYSYGLTMTEYDPIAAKRRAAARASAAEHANLDATANTTQQNITNSSAAAAAATETK